MEKIKNYNQYIKEYNSSEEYLYPKYRYHWGDLGKGRDTYSSSITGQGRDTGHFGTGTYFVSHKPDNIVMKDKDTKDRPLYKIDFSNYNLYNAYGKRGKILHNISKRIADIGYYYYNDNQFNDNKKIVDKFIKLYDETIESIYDLDSEIDNGKLVDEFSNLTNEEYIKKWSEKEMVLYEQLFNFLDDNFEIIFKSVDVKYYFHSKKDYSNILNRSKYSIDEIKKLYNILKDNPPILKLENELNDIILKLKDLRIKINYNTLKKYIEQDFKDKKLDSVFTKIMKDNDFNGIDVGNYDELDNFAYGSVIYELSNNDLNHSIPLNIKIN